MNNLLPTIIRENFFSDAHLLKISEFIQHKAHLEPEYRKTHQRHTDYKWYSDIWRWEQTEHDDMVELLYKPIELLIGQKVKVASPHLLSSKLPYMLHTDIEHVDKKNNGKISDGTWGIIIPMDNYDSRTILFDQAANDTNEFELYKETHKPFDKLQLDPKFCTKNLSHLHPKDLMYLTLHSVFEWKKGSICAFDRRRFHCSDNYIKNNLKSKNGLILWLYQ